MNLIFVREVYKQLIYNTQLIQSIDETPYSSYIIYTHNNTYRSIYSVTMHTDILYCTNKNKSQCTQCVCACVCRKSHIFGIIYANLCKYDVCKWANLHVFVHIMKDLWKCLYLSHYAFKYDTWIRCTEQKCVFLLFMIIYAN